MRDFTYNETQLLKSKYLTANPMDIIQQLGVIVRYCYNFQQLKGFYTISVGYDYIIINGNLNQRMQDVVAAHEPGHYIKHRHLAANSPLYDVLMYSTFSAAEREANEFAANLLITDDEISEQVQEGYDYYALSRIFAYPLELIQLKLNDMRQRGYDFNISDIPDSQFLKCGM